MCAPCDATQPCRPVLCVQRAAVSHEMSRSYIPTPAWSRTAGHTADASFPARPHPPHVTKHVPGEGVSAGISQPCPAEAPGRHGVRSRDTQRPSERPPEREPLPNPRNRRTVSRPCLGGDCVLRGDISHGRRTGRVRRRRQAEPLRTACPRGPKGTVCQDPAEESAPRGAAVRAHRGLGPFAVF